MVHFEERLETLDQRAALSCSRWAAEQPSEPRLALGFASLDDALPWQPSRICQARTESTCNASDLDGRTRDVERRKLRLVTGLRSRCWLVFLLIHSYFVSISLA